MMTTPCHVHFLPSLVRPDELTGATVVVIDILRASSTITTALENRAERVIPCESPAEAFQIRDELLTSSDSAPSVLSPSGHAESKVLLGGERGGIRIPGFDFGNSPAEYSPSNVAGKTVIFTTTNGTRALLTAVHATRILIGAFLNLTALCRHLQATGHPVHLLCAGTDGLVTGEDVLFAGAVVDRLTSSAVSSDSAGNHGAAPNAVPNAWSLNDSARIALDTWCAVTGHISEDARTTEVHTGAPLEQSDREFSEDILSRRLCHTQGGRNLLELGFGTDIERCSRMDTTTCVPVYRANVRPADLIPLHG